MNLNMELKFKKIEINESQGLLVLNLPKSWDLRSFRNIQPSKAQQLINESASQVFKNP
jgi:hypothetical protein